MISTLIIKQQEVVKVGCGVGIKNLAYLRQVIEYKLNSYKEVVKVGSFLIS